MEGSERLRPRLRSRIYRGVCPNCGPIATLVNTEYDPLLRRLISSEKRCLTCDGTDDVKLIGRESSKHYIDINEWMRRVDFTEKISPRVEEKIEFYTELDDFMKNL